MKLLTLLILSLVTVSISRSTNQDHLKRAAEQLNRLSAFHKTQEENPKVIVEENPEIPDILVNDEIKKTSNHSDQTIFINSDTMRRIDDLVMMANKMAENPHYSAIMQERIKRSGSGDFISGIAGKLINGVTGVSSGSSVPKTYDSYGKPVEPYTEPSFSIWDFKKAIINTLIQALKALAGGAIAVKGHLIKGGGFIVQTTGRVISSAGEATSALGTQIASNAVISHPNPSYGAPGYSYGAPHNQDYSYDGPPPNSDATYTQHTIHHHYGQPSGANAVNEPGLLIIKPLKNNADHHQQDYNHNENHQNEQPQFSQPNLSALEESFSNLPQKNTQTLTKIVGSITGTSGIPHTNEHKELIDYNPAEHKDQAFLSPSIIHHDPNSSHLQDNSVPSSPDYNPQPEHHQTKQIISPPSFSHGNIQDIPFNKDYQFSYQQIQSLLKPHLQLPVNDAQFFTDPVANYGLDTSFSTLKIPIVNHQYSNILEIPNYNGQGLSSGHDIPMHHGISFTSFHPNFKRMAFFSPRSKKIRPMNIVVEKAINYKIKDSKLHRI